MGALDVSLYLFIGLVLGGIYFTMLLWTVRLHAAATAAIRILPLYLTRIALAVSLFWVIAQQGALPLVIALLGFLLTRIAMQRWLGSY